MAEAETATTSTFAPYRQLEVSSQFESSSFCEGVKDGRRRTLNAASFHAAAMPQVAVPLEKAGSCLATVGAEVYGERYVERG